MSQSVGGFSPSIPNKSEDGVFLPPKHDKFVHLIIIFVRCALLKFYISEEPQNSCSKFTFRPISDFGAKIKVP